MVLAAKDKVAAVKAKVAAAKAKGKQTEIAAAPTAIPEGSPTAVEATVNEPATNVAEVQPKNPLSARVPAESGDGGDGDVVTGDVVYSLEQITEESGVNAAKVNGYQIGRAHV